MSSLDIADQEAAAVAKAPRVSLASMESKIEAVYHLNGFDAVANSGHPAVEELRPLSICIVVMRNGFVLIGKSAPASPENFDADLGARFAYEDAIRHLWPLEGYALREKLAAG